MPFHHNPFPNTGDNFTCIAHTDSDLALALLFLELVLPEQDSEPFSTEAFANDYQVALAAFEAGQQCTGTPEH